MSSKVSQESIAEFWKKTRQELNDIPIEAQVEAAPEKSGREYNAYSVRLQSYGGMRIRAWYCVPKDCPRGKFKAQLCVPGYGGSREIPIHMVMHGYAVLLLFPRGQGESKAEWQLESDTYLTYNLMDRDRYFYRGAYMDCVRGLDFLCSREEIDPDRIGMWGRSQGGGLTLATSSLDSRLKAAVAEEPFLCNYPLSVDIKTAPYKELNDYLARYPERREKALETLAYFDPINLVENITCSILVNIGLKDDICPYRTIMPVFERIRAQKGMVIYPDLSHTPGTDFNNHAKNWLDEYLG